MKSLFRLVVIVTVALMALTPAVATHAQGTQMCFGLSDSDCKMFYGAFDQAQLAKFTSFVMDYNLDAKFTGTPQGDASVSVQGNGPFGIDPKFASSATSANPMAAMSAIMAGNTIKASASGGGQNMAGNFEWRIVGGTLYFMGDMATQGKWMSISLADAMTSAMSSFSSMSSGSSSSSGPASMLSGANTAFSDPSVTAAFEAIPTIPGFIKADSKAGTQVDGQDTTQITFTFDLVTLVNAKETRPILKAALKSQGGGTADVPDTQVDQVAAMLASALKGSNFQVNWLIGKSDSLIHGFGINIAFHLDASIAAMMTSDSNAKAIDGNITFNITLSKVGQPVSVTAPTGATPINLGAMMGSGGAAAPAPTEAK